MVDFLSKKYRKTLEYCQSVEEFLPSVSVIELNNFQFAGVAAECCCCHSKIVLSWETDALRFSKHLWRRRICFKEIVFSTRLGLIFFLNSLFFFSSFLLFSYELTSVCSVVVDNILKTDFFKGKPVVGEKETSYQEEEEGKRKNQWERKKKKNSNLCFFLRKKKKKKKNNHLLQKEVSNS